MVIRCREDLQHIRENLLLLPGTRIEMTPPSNSAYTFETQLADTNPSPQHMDDKLDELDCYIVDNLDTSNTTFQTSFKEQSSWVVTRSNQIHYNPGIFDLVQQTYASKLVPKIPWLEKLKQSPIKLPHKTFEWYEGKLADVEKSLGFETGI